MLEEYKSYLEEAKTNRKRYKKKAQTFKKLKDKDLDNLMHEAHDEAFNCIDCLQCANCCKTTGPLFTQKDIERIAKHLRIKPGEFIENYLKRDEDDDYVLQSTPCTFLGADNYCSIYEVRPKACAEYPHTDMRNQKRILHLTLKNAEMCPAVALSLKRLIETV
ncbi:YkgJ family cysteine cluster protein [Parvicella tangerina]|uniref:YkgJ family cysteine cluster protein n=1 Tax=Parvicella tangerina TaxID=2829795 RepID=A0A916JQ60_9FLAO|nr:YkgJ family cysteine cluster protein [Parvicella tangerina]CAG5086488.1 hypothetical protein CRYO30217_03140 [Parvicella tangerina]